LAQARVEEHPRAYARKEIVFAVTFGLILRAAGSPTLNLFAHQIKQNCIEPRSSAISIGQIRIEIGTNENQKENIADFVNRYLVRLHSRAFENDVDVRSRISLIHKHDA
jgi:hypothetical protein